MDDGVGEAALDISADAVGVSFVNITGEAEFGVASATATGNFSRQRVRVITTAPRSGRGNTGLSHSGEN